MPFFFGYNQSAMVDWCVERRTWRPSGRQNVDRTVQWTISMVRFILFWFCVARSYLEVVWNFSIFFFHFLLQDDRRIRTIQNQSWFLAWLCVQFVNFVNWNSSTICCTAIVVFSKFLINIFLNRKLRSFHIFVAFSSLLINFLIISFQTNLQWFVGRILEKGSIECVWTRRTLFVKVRYFS